MRYFTLANRHPVHGHFADAVVVDECCRDHEHVEYLMRLELKRETIENLSRSAEQTISIILVATYALDATPPLHPTSFNYQIIPYIAALFESGL